MTLLEQVKLLHKVAHEADATYVQVKRDYFKGLTSEVTLGYYYVSRRQAICELHDKYVEWQAFMRMERLQCEPMNQRDRLEEIRQAAINEK